MAVAALALTLAAAGCGDSAGTSDAASAGGGGAAVKETAKAVARNCPAPRVLDVAGAFTFSAGTPPKRTQPETTLTCAYESAELGADGKTPAANLSFLIGDYGDGADANFTAAVSLADCQKAPEADPANCTTKVDVRYSSYRQRQDALEAIEVDEPLGDLVANGALRMASYTAVFRSGSHVCATSAVQGVAVGEDPEALRALGERMVDLVARACGQKAAEAGASPAAEEAPSGLAAEASCGDFADATAVQQRAFVDGQEIAAFRNDPERATAQLKTECEVGASTTIGEAVEVVTEQLG